MSKPTTYQPHIDGLRAIAVLSVVFYHYGQTVFSGGFVGVDVFFVISGYLITNLILTEISATGDFSFKRFYLRRIRRLFPALACTLAVSLAFAVALFPPEQFQSYGRSLSAAVFSVSNIQFWLESGYFDVDSHLKPLLHTWSLSVEEQFYLFWPALLWFFTRNSGLKRQFSVLAILGIASFALNYAWVNGQFDSDFASTIFYLTPFRIFELVIGGLAVFVPSTHTSRWTRDLTMAIGLALIAYAVLGYSDNIVFPYLMSLAPCIGTLLVIVSGRSRITSRLLTNKLAVGIGLISYSLYLVHWPVLVFYEYYKFDTPSQTEYAILFLTSMALSIFMYFFIEKPFRKNVPGKDTTAPQKAFVVTSVGSMIFIGLLGYYVGQSDGRTWLTKGDLTANEISAGKKQRFNKVRSNCNLIRLDKPKHCERGKKYQILVIGNSHEPDGYNIFSQVYHNNPEVNLISFGSLNSCQVYFERETPSSNITDLKCDQRVAQLSHKGFVDSLDGIIYSANKPFSEDNSSSWKILAHLQKITPSLPMVVLGGYLNTTRDCSELYNRFKTYEACKLPQYITYQPFNEKALSEVPLSQQLDYLYIDKGKLLCSENNLESCIVEANGEPVFYDMHHLSFGFAKFLGEKIASFYAADLTSLGFPSVLPPIDKNLEGEEPK
jgi:peptidoglycan/LPS O-acetylase OafA/YrhL